MSVKRGGQDDGDSAGRSDAIPLAFGAMRAAEGGVRAVAEATKGKGEDEKLSVFWRVFGGTILSICALVAVTLYNNINSTLGDLRAAIERTNESRAKGDAEIHAELAKISEARIELARKDEVQTRVTSIYDRIQGLQNQGSTLNATLTSVKTETDGLKDRVNRSGADVDAARKDLSAALDALRKEQCLTTDALKKDIVSMEAVKDRIMALAADLKVARDDVQKLQKDVDKNQAYDIERRDRREAQYKQLDDNIKELHKAMQECREKMVRLEAIASQPVHTPPPVTAAGGTMPAPAPTPAPTKHATPKAEKAPVPKTVVEEEEEVIDTTTTQLPTPKD